MISKLGIYFEVDFRKKDQLVLFFYGKTTSALERMYAFEYKNQKWTSLETEPLMLHWYHNPIIEGSIRK